MSEKIYYIDVTSTITERRFFKESDLELDEDGELDYDGVDPFTEIELCSDASDTSDISEMKKDEFDSYTYNSVIEISKKS